MMRIRAFSLWLAMSAANLCLPLAASAATVTLNPPNGVSELWVRTRNFSSPVTLQKTLKPETIPFLDSQSITSDLVTGVSSSASTYDLSNSGFTITFNDRRTKNAGTLAASSGAIYFSVDTELLYAMSGSYSAIDPDGGWLTFQVQLRN